MSELSYIIMIGIAQIYRSVCPFLRNAPKTLKSANLLGKSQNTNDFKTSSKSNRGEKQHEASPGASPIGWTESERRPSNVLIDR